MASQLLRHLITHLVVELRDMDAGFGKTKLVKLLYLIDVENWRRSRKTLTGLEWNFYHYGPTHSRLTTRLKNWSLTFHKSRSRLRAAAKHIRSDQIGGCVRILGKVVSSQELRLVKSG